MEEELMKSMRFRQVKADNRNANLSQAIPTQPMAMPARPNIFSGNDAKRMSFDGSMPQYGSLSQSPSTFGLTGGLIGGTQAFNRDRRDSLKNMVHLQDFGTD